MTRLACWCFLAAACAGDPAAPDGGTDFATFHDLAVPPDFSLPNRAPSDHPPLVQLQDHHGVILRAMELYTIVWRGDEQLGADVNRFHEAMLTSGYWTARLGEYGVGAGTAKGVLVIPQAAPATLTGAQLDQMLVQNISSGAWPAPNANTAFAYIVPPTTMVISFGVLGCSGFGGYHQESATGVPYLVDLQCAPGFDTLTEVASHEAAETATDARPATRPGWSAAGVGEVGDLCVGTGYQLVVSGDGGVTDTYQVTRLYSNAAAASGNVDPCGPAPAGEPWFGAAVAPQVVHLVTALDGTGSVIAAMEPFAFSDVGKIRWQISIDFEMPGTGLSAVPPQGSGLAGQTIPVTFKASTLSAPGTYPLSIYASASGLTKTWFTTLVVE